MVEFSRTFSMSAFECVRQIRLRRVVHTGSLQEIIEVIKTVDADGATLDFEAAVELDQILPHTCPIEDAVTFYRECIDVVIRNHRPIWVKTITVGRSFVNKLQRDEQQCFEAAGLLEDPISDAIVAWWGRTSDMARMLNDGFFNEQGRAAEKLSLEHEAGRMARLGLPGSPKWMAVEDNRLGYDILSYDPGPVSPIARVLEVKSTIASPLRFFVTRNEWDVCQKMGSAYHFHIWDMKTGVLHERTAAEIAPHIPTDQGRGRWSRVEIRVGATAPP
jgi:Protein NO VEIN, C-terminal